MSGIESQESLGINNELAEEFVGGYRRERRIGRIANWFLGSSLVAFTVTNAEALISNRGLNIYSAAAGFTVAVAYLNDLRGSFQQEQLRDEREAMGFTPDQQEHILHINGLE